MRAGASAVNCISAPGLVEDWLRIARNVASWCARAVRAITAAIRARRTVSDQLKLLWIETVLTFHPVLLVRTVVVASVGAALALFALASLSPAPPRASVPQMLPVRAPIAASVAYPRDSLAVLSRADSSNR